MALKQLHLCFMAALTSTVTVALGGFIQVSPLIRGVEVLQFNLKTGEDLTMLRDGLTSRVM